MYSKSRSRTTQAHTRCHKPSVKGGRSSYCRVHTDAMPPSLVSLPLEGRLIRTQLPSASCTQGDVRTDCAPLKIGGRTDVSDPCILTIASRKASPLQTSTNQFLVEKAIVMRCLPCRVFDDTCLMWLMMRPRVTLTAPISVPLAVGKKAGGKEVTFHLVVQSIYDIAVIPPKQVAEPVVVVVVADSRDSTECFNQFRWKGRAWSHALVRLNVRCPNMLVWSSLSFVFVCHLSSTAVLRASACARVIA